MYKVVFSKNFANRNSRQEQNIPTDYNNAPHENDIGDDNQQEPISNTTLSTIEPGTEVNVHTAEQTYYNAVFLAYDPSSQKASFLTDRYYKNGNRLVILHSDEITSIDLPVSANEQTLIDAEDE